MGPVWEMTGLSFGLCLWYFKDSGMNATTTTPRNRVIMAKANAAHIWACMSAADNAGVIRVVKCGIADSKYMYLVRRCWSVASAIIV